MAGGKDKVETKKSKGDDKPTKKKTDKEDEKPSKKPAKKSSEKSSDKSSKNKSDGAEKRKSKYADVEKGDSPNKQTAYAKLFFNVSPTKKWLNGYYKKYSIEKKKKDDKDKDDEEDKSVRILNSHFALTATDQVVCLSLVNLAAARCKKADAGLYKITEDDMVSSVRNSREFSFTFERFLNSYDNCCDYDAQMQIGKKNVIKFIENFAFEGGNTNVHLDHGAYNFLMYIMLKNRILLAETAFQMVTYARKSSVDDRAIMYSLRVVYNGSLLLSIFKKVEDVSNIIRNIDTSAGSDDSDGEKTEKGSGKGKKSDKKTEKKSTKKESKSKSDSESESDSGEKSGSESEDSDSDSDKGSDSD